MNIFLFTYVFFLSDFRYIRCPRVILLVGTRSIRLVAKQPRRLVPIHLDDPSSTRSFDESIAASIRYIRLIRYGEPAREYRLLYLEAYFWNLSVIVCRSPERSLYPVYNSDILFYYVIENVIQNVVLRYNNFSIIFTKVLFRKFHRAFF